MREQNWCDEVEKLLKDSMCDHYGDPTDRIAKIINLLHQELQKAREDWLREEIVKLEGMKTGAELRSGDYSEHRGIGFDKALQTIIDRYKDELDQDVSK